MRFIIDIPDKDAHLYGKSDILHIPVIIGEDNQEINWLDTKIPTTPFLDETREEIENEVWKLAQIIEMMDAGSWEECFDTAMSFHHPGNLYGHSYKESKEKYEKWEKEKNQIKVWDEIEHKEEPVVRPFIVTRIIEDGNTKERYFYGFYSDTGEFCEGGLNYTKTGRTFDDIRKVNS